MEADDGNTEAKDALEELKMKYSHTRGLLASSSAQTTTQTADKTNAQQSVLSGENVNHKKDTHANYLTNSNPQSVFNNQHAFDGLKEKYVHERRSVLSVEKINHKKDEHANSLTNNPQRVFNDQHVVRNSM